MGDLPRTAREYTKRRRAFEAWLVEHGSAILAVTNSWEVARFVSAEGVGVIYRNAQDRLNWVGGSDIAFQCFVNNKQWRACKRQHRASASDRQRRNLFNSLVQRDGDGCLYCGQAVTFDAFSKEHIVALTHGGPEHLANLAVTHASCNAKVSHLSAREKFEIAFRARLCVGP